MEILNEHHKYMAQKGGREKKNKKGKKWQAKPCQGAI